MTQLYVFDARLFNRTHPNDQQQNRTEYVILFCDDRLDAFLQDVTLRKIRGR